VHTLCHPISTPTSEPPFFLVLWSILPIPTGIFARGPIFDRGIVVRLETSTTTQFLTCMDTQVRLGILDDPTAPALDVSWRKVKRSVSEGRAKASEAVTYIARACKLLGSDTWCVLLPLISSHQSRATHGLAVSEELCCGGRVAHVNRDAYTSNGSYGY